MVYSDWEHIAGKDAGSFTDGGRKLCLHTTEGSSIAGAVGAYTKNNSWPHATIDFKTRRAVRHLPLNVAARSLSNNNADGYQVGRANVFQVEIVGIAGKMYMCPQEELNWYAERFKDIRAVFDFPLQYLPFTVPANRLADETWVNVEGIVGHCHAPDNDHWDPGGLDVGYIVERMKGEVVPPLPLGESKILGVNWIDGEGADAPSASVWGQIACNHDGCGLWRFNLKEWPSTIPNGQPVFRGPRFDQTGIVPIFSVSPDYGSAELSIDVDGNGVVVTLTGAPSAAVFQLWCPVAKGN